MSTLQTPASLPVKLIPSNIRPVAYRILSKKHGLNIQTDALEVLTDVISTRFGAEWRGAKTQSFIEEIAKSWKQQDRGVFIDGNGLKQVIKELTKDKSVAKTMSSFIEPVRAERLDTLVDMGNEIGSDKELLNWEEYFRFVTPDIQPNFKFDKVRKQFVLQPVAGSKLKSTYDSSMSYFSQRYNLTLDRLSRDENFHKTSFSSIAALNTSLKKPSGYEITLIKNVLGRDGLRFMLFGLLSKNINGNYILEDTSDYIELNMTQAHKTEGSFYCTGMLVIIEGIYSASGGSMSNDASVISGCFHVSNIGHPPAERREIGLEVYGNLDFMGIHSDALTQTKSSALVKVDKALRRKLSALEKLLVNHKLLLLGCNLHLDDAKIVLGLRKLFEKLEVTLEEQQDNPQSDKPLAIVMPGSFVSQPLAPISGTVHLASSSENYKNNFDNFAELLSKFPLVVNRCKFVLVPGPNDPWQSAYSLGRLNLNTLPQSPVPNVFVTRLERLLPKGNLILGWNPMRINYISQEIVLFRDDLMDKFKRNDIVFQHDLELEKLQLKREQQGEDKNVENIIGGNVHLTPKVKQARQLVKTLLDQGNLQLFLKDLRVVNPNYHHLMRIDCLPTTIVLFDSRFECFDVTYNGCKVVNVGSAVSNQNTRKLNYAEYLPCMKKYKFESIYF